MKQNRGGITVMGPNGPGITVPGECKIGIMPNQIFRQGDVAVASRSGTLTYEIVDHITRSGLGESAVIGLGGDPVVGLTYIDVLKLFEADERTKRIVLVGEIGGNNEELASSNALIFDSAVPTPFSMIAPACPISCLEGHFFLLCMQLPSS